MMNIDAISRMVDNLALKNEIMTNDIKVYNNMIKEILAAKIKRIDDVEYFKAKEIIDILTRNVAVLSSSIKKDQEKNV